MGGQYFIENDDLQQRDTRESFISKVIKLMLVENDGLLSISSPRHPQEER